MALLLLHFANALEANSSNLAPGGLAPGPAPKTQDDAECRKLVTPFLVARTARRVNAGLTRDLNRHDAGTRILDRLRPDWKREAFYHQQVLEQFLAQ